MYKLLNMSNIDEWLNIVKSFKDSDIYFYPQYLKSFEENGDGEPFLFYLENEYGRVMNVFMKRDVSTDKNLNLIISPDQYYDISTVYGYGGPLYETENINDLKETYDAAFSEFCNDNNIVSEFIRFHPLIKNEKFLKGYCDIQNIKSTGYIDLRKGVKNVWNNFKRQNRQTIRKAINSNIQVIFTTDKSYVNCFKNLYKQTMDRNNALQYYYFNENVFYTIVKDLKDNSFMAVAKYKDKVICASLIIFNEKYVHYHLGGSNSDYMKLGANNLLLYEIAKWGCNTGRLFFHLGGGYKGDDDSLFRYKRTFCGNNILKFYIGKRIYKYDVYDYLVDKRSKVYEDFDYNNSFFPLYRAPLLK